MTDTQKAAMEQAIEALEHRSHLLKAEDDQIAMLTTQRDALLEALLTARDHIYMDALEISHRKDAERIRAAIAKVEGEKT